jgi:hypothetical protein
VIKIFLLPICFAAERNRVTSIFIRFYALNPFEK